MKSKIIIAALLLAASAACGQKKAYVDIHAGMAIAKTKTTESGMAGENYVTGGDRKQHYGLAAGIGLAFPISEILRCKTGLDVKVKGVEESAKTQFGDCYGSTSPVYMQIPALLSVGTDIGKNVRIEANGGFYIAYGIGGKFDLSVEKSGKRKEIISIDCFGDKGMLSNGYGGWSGDLGLNRFDFGGILGADVILFDRIMVGAAYEWGFVNICNTDVWQKKFNTVGAEAKNRCWSVTAGYIF